MDRRMAIIVVIVIVIAAAYMVMRRKSDKAAAGAAAAAAPAADVRMRRKDASPSPKTPLPVVASPFAVLSGAHRDGCDGNYVLDAKDGHGSYLYFKTDINNQLPGQESRVVIVSNKDDIGCYRSTDASIPPYWQRSAEMDDGWGTLSYDKALWRQHVI